MKVKTFIIIFLCFLCCVPLANAHPHLFIKLSANMDFDEKGNMVGLTEIWLFDQTYTAYVLQGAQQDVAGEISQEQLQPLADDYATGLAEFSYFTKAVIDNRILVFEKPQSVRMNYKERHLEYNFSLRFREPIRPVSAMKITIYDDSNYVSFLSDDRSLISINGYPTVGCFVGSSPDSINAKSSIFSSTIYVKCDKGQ